MCYAKISSPKVQILTFLQPEPDLPSGAAGALGGGWGGVYRWCRQLVSMQEPVALNPSLSGFDLILLHLDADVAGERYENANITNGSADLPCRQPCPPAADSVDGLRRVVLSWLELDGDTTPPARWVFCNPSLCSETWLITALYREREPGIMIDIECNQTLEHWLANRPIREGRFIRSGKKQTSAYRNVESLLTNSWDAICNHCTQAGRFTDELRAAWQPSA
ncbi:MAG: hypothetical protein AB1568_15325 [Thermodesulfobacteriota bacterium]